MVHGRRVNQRFFIGVGTVLAVVLTSAALLVPAAQAAGATQIGGVGFFANEKICVPVVDPAGTPLAYALILTGDLDGCLYTYIETSSCSPSGAYREIGHEIFVGDYQGAEGTFQTTYRFEGKYGDCDPLGTEIFGRCQHPIVEGSGTGVFTGVRGRLNFKDNVAEQEFPYRGHLQWTSSGVHAQALSARTAC